MRFLTGLALFMDIVFFGLAMYVFYLEKEEIVMNVFFCLPFFIFLGCTFWVFYTLGKGHPADPDIMRENKEYLLLGCTTLPGGRRSIIIVRDDDGKVWCFEFDGPFIQGNKERVRKREPLGNEESNFKDDWGDRWIIEPAG